MPSAKNTSSAMCTSSGVTSMMVLISQRRPTRMPAQRSHTGHASVPESAAFALSTSRSLSATVRAVVPRTG
jgi:hypothetical protein